MALTYKELADKILALPEENQKQNVTISMDLSEEVVPVEIFWQINADDRVCGGILDSGHPVLTCHF